MRTDHDAAVFDADDRAAARAHTDDLAQRNGHPDAFDVPTTILRHAAIDVLPDVGCRATHVERHHIAEAVELGKRLQAFDAATRAGAVGLDGDGLGHARGVAVVAEDQQRVLGAELAQPVFGVVEKGFHARVQEGVDQSGPGATGLVAVDAQVTAIEHGHRSQQVTRVLAQRDLAEGSFGGHEVGTAKAHHDARCTHAGQRVDGLDHRHACVFAREVRRVDIDHTFAHQGCVDVGVKAGQFGHAFSGTRVDDQSQPRALALADGVGALSGRVADQLDFLEQPLDVGLAVDHARGLFQPFEEALAQVVRRGEHLGLLDPLAVDDADIGQRSAVVDVDLYAHGRFPVGLADKLPVRHVGRKAGVA